MLAEIAQMIGRTTSSVDNRRRKLGLKREQTNDALPAPEDLAERLPTMSIRQLSKFYGRATSVIIRWMFELDLKRKVTSGRKKVIPENFRKMAPTMTSSELMRLYSTDRKTIRGWLHELGIKALSITERHAQKTKTVDIKIEEDRPVEKREFSSHTKLIAAEAANFLRRTHPSVHRADIRMYEQSSHTWGDVKNVPHRGINQYFVAGKGVMWLDDLIAYAKTKGFKIKELI